MWNVVYWIVKPPAGVAGAGLKLPVNRSDKTPFSPETLPDKSLLRYIFHDSEF